MCSDMQATTEGSLPWSNRTLWDTGPAVSPSSATESDCFFLMYVGFKKRAYMPVRGDMVDEQRAFSKNFQSCGSAHEIRTGADRERPRLLLANVRQHRKAVVLEKNHAIRVLHYNALIYMHIVRLISVVFLSYLSSPASMLSLYLTQ